MSILDKLSIKLYMEGNNYLGKCTVDTCTYAHIQMYAKWSQLCTCAQYIIVHVYCDNNPNNYSAW